MPIATSDQEKLAFEARLSDDVLDDVDGTPDRSLMPPPPALQPQAPHKARKFSPRFLEVSRARKRLDFSQTLPTSFSLTNLHQYYFGKVPTAAHAAEQDCLTLMRVCAHEGTSFVSFAEKLAVPFSQVEKMW